MPGLPAGMARVARKPRLDFAIEFLAEAAAAAGGKRSIGKARTGDADMPVMEALCAQIVWDHMLDIVISIAVAMGDSFRRAAMTSRNADVTNLPSILDPAYFMA